MPQQQLGAGATTDQTTRVTAATDSPDVEALGTPADDPAQTSADETTLIGLLKAVFAQQQETAAATLRELRRIRVGLQLLLPEDAPNLETVE